MRSVLSGERVALNFLQHLSGVATQTHRYTSLVADLPCQILDTRKTTPGWRLLEKYAVRQGGGHTIADRGSRGLKLGDVLTIRNGTTVEIHNTDAEGRLVLADGLSLALEEQPDAIVDIATLTGAVLGALGKKVAGVLGNDQGWVDQVLGASARTDERAWQLPLVDEYRKLLGNEEMLSAAWNSLIIGLVASAVSTMLGTMAGYAMYRFKLRLLPVFIVAPIAIPEILMGVSLLIFFVAINLTLGLVSIALAHIAFCIGFVAIVVRARLAGMDESLIEAARDLGATPLRAFRLVTLPLIMPGVIAGALMAFTLSIDDFVITFFTAGAGTVTLPLQIYSMIKIAVTPEVNAVSTLLMLLTLVLIVIAS
jgi:spermidine/putrescine transport system permease protein